MNPLEGAKMRFKANSSVLLLALKCTKAALTFNFLKSSKTIFLRVRKNHIYLETHFAHTGPTISTSLYDNFFIFIPCSFKITFG